MKTLKEIDSAGWGFFGIAFALLAPPGIWLVYSGTAAYSDLVSRICAGIMLAALAAAIVTWIANDLLFRRNRRCIAAQQQARQAEERPGKKRKHK